MLTLSDWFLTNANESSVAYFFLHSFFWLNWHWHFRTAGSLENKLWGCMHWTQDLSANSLSTSTAPTLELIEPNYHLNYYLSPTFIQQSRCWMLRFTINQAQTFLPEFFSSYFLGGGIFAADSDSGKARILLHCSRRLVMPNKAKMGKGIFFFFELGSENKTVVIKKIFCSQRSVADLIKQATIVN